MENEEDVKRLLEHIVRAHRETIERSLAYTNIIIALGYAGCFWLLKETKILLGDLAFNVASLAIVISVLSFVLHEIAGMLLRQHYSKKIAQIFLNQKFSAQEKILRVTDIENNIILKKVSGTLWLISFSISLITGLCAAGIMLYAYSSNIITSLKALCHA